MFSNQRPSLVAAIIVCMSFLFVGCNEKAAVAPKSKPLPKLDFHKPESFDAAVKRLREIHTAILSDEALPSDISYRVVAVSHSHGEGNAHVHYHLDESDGHVHDENCNHDHGDDDHEHRDPFGETDPNKHTVFVDVFTELKDIARWLPDIGSDGDLPQGEWKQAKTLSEEMTNHLFAIAGSGMPSVHRTNYQSDPTIMEKCIGKLESLVPPATDQTPSE